MNDTKITPADAKVSDRNAEADSSPKPLSLETLVTINKSLLEILDTFAESARSADDPRWYFTVAHAQITRDLLVMVEHRGIKSPNETLTLNMLFTAKYADAITGHPSPLWKETFSTFCQSGTPSDPVSKQETLRCGAAMMQTHILSDLRESLDMTGCSIDREDFGNILSLVEGGSKKASRLLYGDKWSWQVGLFTFLYRTFMETAASLVDPKSLRNVTYEDRCSEDVPDPTEVFEEKVKDIGLE